MCHAFFLPQKVINFLVIVTVTIPTLSVFQVIVRFSSIHLLIQPQKYTFIRVSPPRWYYPGGPPPTSL